MIRQLPLLLILVLFTAAAVPAPLLAQTAPTVTSGSTPAALAPGSPVGSYSVSEFEQVNLYNGRLDFSLPLFKVAGRGDAGFTVFARLGTTWVVTRELNPGFAAYNNPHFGWWNTNGGILGAPRMNVRAATSRDVTLCNGNSGYYLKTLTRLTFTAPDGTEYELRDQLTQGQPASHTSNCGAFNRGRVFVSSDGSAATFVADSDVYDADPVINTEETGLDPDPFEPGPSISGYLTTSDGTRYRVDNRLVTSMRDRNGNKVTFGYDASDRITSITDPLNRQVTVTYLQDRASVNFKGSGGTNRIITIYYGTPLRSDVAAQTCQQLFPELHMIGPDPSYCHPSLISAIELPNGRQYHLYYNGYNELARIELPTGGAIEYDYAGGTTDGPADGVLSFTGSFFGHNEIYRRIVERRVYPNGGNGSSYSSRTTYSRPESSTSNAGYVATTDYGSGGGVIRRSYHYFLGSPRASLDLDPVAYPVWNEGKEYQTIEYDSDGFTPLRKTTTSWAQRAPVAWWTGDPNLAPPNDPRVTATSTTLMDTNQASSQTFGYDDSVPFNNRNNVKEYGYDGAQLRETRTTFVTSPSYIDTTSANPVSLLSLPLQVSVYDGSVEVARTTYEYDTYNATTGHAALTNRSGISGFDSAFSTSYATRGNVTAITRYLLVNGSVTGSITSYVQYDIAGNVVKTIDGRGYATTFDFSDRFGSPDAEARSNTSPSELGIQSSYAFPTLVTNALGHTTYTQFDYYLGRAVNTEDANGVITSSYFNDLLDRPTQLIHAANKDATVKSQTVFAYDDVNRVVTATSDQTTYGDNVLSGSATFDGLGRTIQKRNASSYTDTSYDALGRIACVSNPHATTSAPTDGTTCYSYDGLGRTKLVTEQDGSTVQTSYSGNSVTVTDEAGKQRKSISDALGRLVEVDEPGRSADTNVPAAAGTGSVSISGTLWSQAGTQSTGSVTIGGAPQHKKICDPEGCAVDWFYVDNLGPVSITVNGFTKSASANTTTDTSAMVAGYLASAFNADTNSPVTASASGSTVYLTSKATGTAANYSLSTGCSYMTEYFTSCAFTGTRSGPNMTGGIDGSYDSGTTNVIINGQQISYPWSGTSTTAGSIASGLAAAVNSGSSYASASASGTTVTLTARTTGASTNYSLSTSTTQQHASFASNASGSTFTGGQDAQVIPGTWSLSTPYVTLYRYDVFGNLRCVEQHGTAATSSVTCTNPDDGIVGGEWRVRKFQYDSLGQLLSAANPESGATTYTYDNNGNVTLKVSPGRNQTGSLTQLVKYCYDELNRLKGKDYLGTGDCVNGFYVRYLYDQTSYNGLAITNGIGRRTGMADLAGSTAWTYDSMGRALKERRTISSVTKELTYTYNLDGSEKTLTYPSTAVVTFAYDNAARLTSASDSGNNINYATSAGYTPTGALSALTLGNSTSFAGYTIANQYNNRLQPTVLSTAKPGGTILSRTYTYGPTAQNNGNISAITDNLVADRSVSYAYDGLNRIASAQSTGTDCSTVPGNTAITKNWGNAYAIDAWGNLIAKDVTKCQSEWLSTTVNSKNQLGLATWDSAGNLIVMNGIPYYYDYENRIKQIGNDIQYVYDGDGVRVKKSGGSAAPTLYWGESFTAGPIAETDLAGTIKAEYVYFGGKRIARRDLPSGAVHYYFSDHLNSTNLVYSASGALEEDSDFYPYGGERGYTLGTGNHFKFTGKERDPESGLDYFGARYYGNSLGRYLTPDWADNATAVPYADFGDPQSLNLYAYVRNNPVWRVDGDGHECAVCPKIDLNSVRELIDKGTQEGKALIAAASTTSAAGAGSGAVAVAGTGAAIGIAAYFGIESFSQRYYAEANLQMQEAAAANDVALRKQNKKQQQQQQQQAENDSETPPPPAPKPSTSGAGARQGGGRNERKSNQDRVDANKQEETAAKAEVARLQSLPVNQRPANYKEQLSQAQGRLNRARDRQRKSETHSRKHKGTQ